VSNYTEHSVYGINFTIEILEILLKLIQNVMGAVWKVFLHTDKPG